MPRDLAALNDTLFDARLESDYQATAVVAAEDLAEWLVGAESFVAHVEALLAAQG